jgi:hypothetical protein
MWPTRACIVVRDFACTSWALSKTSGALILLYFEYEDHRIVYRDIVTMF